MFARVNWKHVALLVPALLLVAGSVTGCGPGETSKAIQKSSQPPQGPTGGGGGTSAPPSGAPAGR